MQKVFHKLLICSQSREETMEAEGMSNTCVEFSCEYHTCKISSDFGKVDGMSWCRALCVSGSSLSLCLSSIT